MIEAKSQISIHDIHRFWSDNPLFAEDGAHELGSPSWFEEHAKIVINDGYAGHFDSRILPPPENCGRVLDLGCGPGFWTVELLRRCKIDSMTSADLTERALELAKARLAHYGLAAEHRIENAEAMTFSNASFDHVNCQGVIHHTPNTSACVAEIARVLRSGGTASISVYYRNVVLRHWHSIGAIGGALASMGAKLRGRGREGIYRERDADEIVRLYDGSENPIGKSYDRSQFQALLQPHFEVEKIYYHFFPARSLPFAIPRLVHRVLDARLPFMIFANVRKH
ncbi:class I SAM-dependent methyltransferase [Bradyrhizobium sediminis]|uniref:Class I SAM-dependent methyltransferase n=1 Tax=Bradyrhizobium sediminis TaxID=2840469 RepID=A0A975RNM7_9BRAD|nr:class I SAM-dependent methyltransferase [Bradyrhizobium sediminis]QWG14877.1 class I SAM-dependent methyltransferase [Bradyrhizobium sediminis]